MQTESLPATDPDRFRFVERLIDDCDRCMPIIAGRCGRAMIDGARHPEMGWRHAVAMGVPVPAMIRGDRGQLPLEKREATPEGRGRLARFNAGVE